MRCSQSSFPALGFFCAATAGRDKQRAGREKLRWFPAGRGKRGAISALLSQKVFQSQLRACNVPTSVRKHAGAPLHSLLDLSDIHISSSQFPALQSLDWLLATFPMEREATLVLLITEVMKSLSQLCWDRALEGRANVWSAASTQLMVQGVSSSSSTTRSFLIFLKPSTKQSQLLVS